MPHAVISGQRIHFEDTGGDGPAVLLAHGFLMDSQSFAAQVAALRGPYRVVTWDQRGFGRTEFDGRPFSFWDSARDCLGLLDHLGIGQAVVGGMSQGGFVALRTALLAPHRVRGLVLLNTEAGVFDAEERAANDAMRDQWLTTGPTDDLAEAVAGHIIGDPAHSPAWIRKWTSRPKEFFACPYECLATRDDITGRLSGIHCPAVVVHGTEDLAIAMDRAEILAAGLPGSGGVVKVRGSHAACLTNPLAVNAAILGFLAALPS